MSGLLAMIALLLTSVAFVSFAFWLGYNRREQEIRALASECEGYTQEGAWSLHMTSNDAGDIEVRAVFNEPIMVGGIAVHPSGTIGGPAEQFERFEVLIRQARERARAR